MSEYIEQSQRVARMGNTIESLKELVDEVIPVVEAACEYVDTVREAAQVPVSEERKIMVRTRLHNAVINYQEGQL